MSLSKIPFLLAGLVTAHTLQTPPKALLPANREKTVGWLEWYITNAARFNCKVVKVTVPILFLKIQLYLLLLILFCFIECTCRR